MKEESTIHIGKMLDAYIRQKKISQAALARKIGRKNPVILYYFKQESLPGGILLKLCHALKHNFFADIAALLPETYTTSVAPDISKEGRISALERELEILRAEKQVLLEAMNKRMG